MASLFKHEAEKIVIPPGRRAAKTMEEVTIDSILYGDVYIDVEAWKANADPLVQELEAAGFVEVGTTESTVWPMCGPPTQYPPTGSPEWRETNGAPISKDEDDGS